MAFYDFLLGGRRQLQANIKRLIDRNAQAEDREGSARWLADNGSEEALYGMFGRFDLQVEHSLKDRKEKELVFELLLEKGQSILPIARRFATASPNFQYAVRIVERLSSTEEAVALLLELLSKESIENEFKTEKKRTLLIALAERKDPRICPAAAPFLDDHDEGVRAAAVEAIGAQSEEAPQTLLLKALSNKREESTRIRGRLGEIFAERKWPLPDDPWLLNHLPQGFRLEAGILMAAPKKEGIRLMLG